MKRKVLCASARTMPGSDNAGTVAAALRSERREIGMTKGS